MARKRSSSHKKESVNELDILFPERSAEIAGRSITVREYSFVEGQRLLHLAEPFVKDVISLFAGDTPDYTDIQFIAAKHIDNLIELVSVSIDQPKEWVNSLSNGDGDLLMNIWWSVNGNFYIRSAMIAAEQKKQINK